MNACSGETIPLTDNKRRRNRLLLQFLLHPLCREWDEKNLSYVFVSQLTKSGKMKSDCCWDGRWSWTPDEWDGSEMPLLSPITATICLVTNKTINISINTNFSPKLSFYDTGYKDNLAFSDLNTPEAILENLCFQERKMLLSVDRGPRRREKYVLTKLQYCEHSVSLRSRLKWLFDVVNTVLAFSSFCNM